MSDKQETPEAHVKALDDSDLARLRKLVGSRDLRNHRHQREFAALIERSHFRSVRVEVSPADVAIEYLFVAKKLAVADICSELRQHRTTCRKRLMHLAKEAHEQLKSARCEAAVA